MTIYTVPPQCPVCGVETQTWDYLGFGEPPRVRSTTCGHELPMTPVEQD